MMTFCFGVHIVNYSTFCGNQKQDERGPLRINSSVVFRFERESPASHARKTTRGSACAAKSGKERESPGGEKQFDFSTKISLKKNT
jgi:hypothetical protein